MAGAEMKLSLMIEPSEETMALCLALLNSWQQCNPRKMVVLVPYYDKYQYEIIDRWEPHDMSDNTK